MKEKKRDDKEMPKIPKKKQQRPSSAAADADDEDEDGTDAAERTHVKFPKDNKLATTLYPAMMAAASIKEKKPTAGILKPSSKLPDAAEKEDAKGYHSDGGALKQQKKAKPPSSKPRALDDLLDKPNPESSDESQHIKISNEAFAAILQQIRANKNSGSKAPKPAAQEEEEEPPRKIKEHKKRKHADTAPDSDAEKEARQDKKKEKTLFKKKSQKERAESDDE